MTPEDLYIIIHRFSRIVSVRIKTPITPENIAANNRDSLYYSVNETAVYLYSTRLAKLLTAVALDAFFAVNVSLTIFYCDYLLWAGARALSAADTLAFYNNGARLKK